MTRPNIVIINLKCWSILGSLSIFYQHQHVLSTRQSNFQLSVESYSGLVWFHLSSHCYWSRRFAPSPQPIRCKTKNNRGGQAHFPALQAVCLFSFLSSHWLVIKEAFVLFISWDTSGFWFFDTHLITGLKLVRFVTCYHF